MHSFVSRPILCNLQFFTIRIESLRSEKHWYVYGVGFSISLSNLQKWDIEDILRITRLLIIQINKSFGSLFYNFTDHYLTRISMLQLSIVNRWTKPIKHFHYRQQPVSDKESTAPKWQPTPDPPASVRSYMKASSILDTKRYNTIKWTTWYMWWGYQTQKLFSKLNHLCLQIHQHY